MMQAVPADDGRESPPRQSPSMLWVGNDSTACDHASLAQAISAADPGDTIRVARDQDYRNTPYEIDKSLTVSGGWDGCGQGRDPGNRSDLSATFNSRVIEISHPNSTVSLDVELENLNVAAGVSLTDGGGIIISGPHEVTLRETLIGANRAEGNGGGIAVHDGALLRLEGSNDIALNRADNDEEDDDAAGSGGGIACWGGAAVRAGQGAMIRNNTARLDGGGIFAEDCDVEFASGGSGNLGIRNNEAEEGRGGGIYFEGNGELVLDGADEQLSDPSHPVTIAGNTSAGGGGGINIRNASSAELVNTVLEGNESTSSSGAPSALSVFNASIMMRSEPDAPCRLQLVPGGSSTCSKVINNVAGVGSSPVVRFFSRTDASVLGTEISGNQLVNGPVVWLDNESDLLMENSLIVDNALSGVARGEVIYLSSFSQPTSAFIRWTTLAGHHADHEQHPFIRARSSADGEIELFLEGLVLDDSRPATLAMETLDAGEAKLRRAACIVGPDTQFLENQAESDALVIALIDDEPMLENPQQGNFRPQPGSPAVDLCDWIVDGPIAVLQPPGIDIDGMERGIPNSEETSTRYDVGAFEWLGPVIFRDRFE
ncbi:hypothetical protein IC757_12170 [Wenzhouxiangella sp. AB-CW3]|uniref:hypothetical protein n=1 Tax=Wenzhouxiangella sp. AB-CW3 TaxID=2771012 RepID=UPI00168C04EC|nr:hypothetical protein [Wenzhouxiangella sp. AB-CW3]QOC21787.1 hypothetical protein IC757_12170 [Wenzhouxiangella sp. AB-CW3]